MPVSHRAARATAALALLALLAPAAAPAQPATRNLTFKSQRNDYAPAPGGQNYSACWSYVHSDGREYAVLGVNGLTSTTGGTAIYNITDPSAPFLAGFIQGPQSVWREMKSYRNWIYVVTEGAGTGYGLQIIRMTNPDSPVLAATYTTNFVRSHTVAVDTTRGLLVCNGTRDLNGFATGMRILALNDPGIGATPETPVEVSWWPGGAIPVSTVNYVHDSVPIGNRLYASSIYFGIERVIDIADPAAPSELSSWTYPGGFSHNSWPDATGNWLYVTDEVKGEPLKIFDISNLASPVLANAITSNPQAIVHNAHVAGSELFLSNYTEGIRLLDLSDPAHPAEFGWGDSYPGPSGGFGGVWAVAPFYPSGTVIASDRNSGLYVYRVERDYGVIRARVINGGAAPAAHACGPVPGSCCCAPGPCTCDVAAAPGDPFPDVEAHLTSQGDSLTTPADGIVQFAPNPGLHTVLAHKFGYYDATATVNVTLGSRDTVTLELLPKPTALFTGVVRDQTTSDPLDGAEVSLAYTHVHQHTGASGLYSLDLPDDMYLLQIRRGGYVPLVFERRIGPGFPGQDYSLMPAPVWDPLEVAGGWTVGAAGDNATSGLWTRVTPQGTGPRPPVTPPPGPLAATGAGRSAGPGPAGPALVSAYDASGRARAGSALARMNPQFRELLSEIRFADADGGVAVAGLGGRGGASPMHEEEEPVAAPNMAPYFDHTALAGTMCFVTGNSADSVNVDAADVDGGKTSLTTPALDLTGMSDPVIGYWRWFTSFWPIGTSSGHNGADPSDYLAVLISDDNGVNWTAVDTISGLNGHWEEEAIRVADFVTPTAQVKVRFVAADGGSATTCEAGIDDLVVYDAATVPVAAPPPASPGRLAFRPPSPNPASGSVRFVLEVPTAGEAAVDVVDVAGRMVRTLHRGGAAAGPLTLAWDGRDASGREAPAGLYFARATVGAERALTRFVRVR
jgi:choice-of-anchor B domain-containing protein